MQQPRLDACGGVLVDQVLRGGLIELSGGDAKCLVGALLVFGFDRGADSARCPWLNRQNTQEIPNIGAQWCRMPLTLAPGAPAITRSGTAEI